MMKSRILSLVLLGLMLGACSRLEEPTVSWQLAVVRGDIEQVERHIHWDTDINTPFPNGRYPLHEAAAKGRVIMLKLLLENDARLDVEDTEERTPLELAVLNGRTQAASVLLRANAQLDASKILLVAARKNVEDRDVVRFLKEQGADFEVTDDQGNTPLMLAVSQKNHRLTHHLVEQGADVNATNKVGKTPLALAEEVGATELVLFLQRNGGVRGQAPGQ
jgi:ankyrin repeat protein